MSYGISLYRGFVQRARPALNLGAKFRLVCLLVLLLAAGNVLYLHSVLNRVDGVAETVNIAGKLRMLSQKIALEALREAPQTDRQLPLTATLDDYEEALQALEHGGQAFGLTIAGVPSHFKGLTGVLRNHWGYFRDEVESSQGSLSRVPLAADAIVLRAETLLKTAEALVEALTQEAKRTRRQALTYLYLLFLIEAVALGSLLWLLRRRVVLPLVQLARGTRALAAGNYQAHIEFRSRDELGELVDTFNFASQQIGRLVAEINTERQALSQAESMFRGLAENSIVGVYVAQDERFLFVNRMMAEMFDYPRSQMLESLRLLDLFVEEDWPIVAEGIRQRVDGEVDSVIYEARGQRQDGSVFDVEVFGSKMEIEGRMATLGVVLDVSTRRSQQRELEYLANHDVLTGLANRTLLDDHIQQAIALVRRAGNGVAVLMLDLDYFKVVNDSLGHDAGDLLLRAVAERLRDSVRDGDTVARFGGDEFVVVMPNVERPDDAAVVAAKIQSVLSRSFEIRGHEVFVGVSVGIALFPQDGDADALVRSADLAMYRAKQEGRSAFRFYSAEMDARNKKRLLLERELHHAINSGDLTLVYQPKVCLRSGRVVGAEALLRWQHPVLGAISPLDFIPLAEDTGLILPIGEWVIRNACAQNRQWQQVGLTPITMAVNLSGKQFRNFDLFGCVEQTLAQTGLAAHHLELELTESILMEQIDDALGVIEQLKACGVRFSMDDFGSGYSSLNNLQRLPFDNLKLDKAFIGDVDRASDSGEIVKVVIALGRALGLNTVAEGVETVEQLRFLMAHGCAEAQGHYFSKPLPPEQFAGLLSSSPAFALPRA